jgi:hypothetical protein
MVRPMGLTNIKGQLEEWLKDTDGILVVLLSSLLPLTVLYTVAIAICIMGIFLLVIYLIRI